MEKMKIQGLGDFPLSEMVAFKEDRVDRGSNIYNVNST